MIQNSYKEIIPKDHLLLTSSAAISQICQPLFNTTLIKYFDLTRLDHQGLINELSTNGPRSKFIYEQKDENCYMGPTIPQQLLKNLKYYYFPLEEQKNKFFITFREKYQIDYIFSIIEKYENHTDCYCFGTTLNNYYAINFYLNNIEKLLQFGHFFKDQAKHFIQQFDKNKIIPPSRCQEVYLQMNSSTVKKISYSKFSNLLTAREIDCLNYICSGYTIKEVAKTLLLSPRTIETHVNHIKIKLNIKKTKDIVKFILENSDY